MKYLRVLATVLIFSFILTSYVHATNDTTVQELVGNSTDNTNTTPMTTPTKENPLGLNIPNQTDNPSTIITFANPSQTGAIVQLEIDSKGFVDITSPYSLPALSIGKHTLEFKYQDENATTQIYSTSIIIIPRSPILSTPIITAESITISGTGLANSEIIIQISSGTTVSTKAGEIDEEGKWSLVFSRADIPNDIYSISGYIRKYGYASNLSEVTKFTLDTSDSSNNKGEYLLDLSQFSITVAKQWVLNHQTYILVTFCALILGIAIGAVSKAQHIKQIAQKTEDNVAKEFQKNTSKKPEITLREKLMGSEQKNETKKETEKDTVINKIDFLKDYKNFDPDDINGKEDKASVNVTLTSKK
jgi:hypothetical protein